MATQQQQPGALYNALTAGSKIIGTVIADSDFRVDGTVEGDIQSTGKVVIGEQGKIETKHTLALRATGNIKGDVKTQTLIVEPNAIFNGSCSMGKEEAPAKK